MSPRFAASQTTTADNNIIGQPFNIKFSLCDRKSHCCIFFALMGGNS
jgi:hypothetical protein